VGVEHASGEPVDILGVGLAEALHPLTGPAHEVQAFDGSAGGCEVHFSTTEPVVYLSSNGTLVITGGGWRTRAGVLDGSLDPRCRRGI
jgi:hypothetical protein